MDMQNIIKINKKREMLILEAYQVFYQQGFQSTCMDDVLKSTGISKRTLYKYFRSKEELIAATITHYQNTSFAAIEAEIERRTNNPKEKILTLFDLKKEDLEAGRFNGCFAINAKLEYDGKNAVIEKACLVFMDTLKNFIHGLCVEAKCKDPDITSTRLMILLEGAIIYGQATRNPEITLQARHMAASALQKPV